jgi:hypothetical protein
MHFVYGKCNWNAKAAVRRYAYVMANGGYFKHLQRSSAQDTIGFGNLRFAGNSTFSATCTISGLQPH